MDSARDGYVRNFKSLSLKMSDGSRVKGRINLGDSFHRLSDLFRQSTQPFLVLVPEDSAESPNKVFIVNREYILWAEAEE